jgi:hypothetical protein
MNEKNINDIQNSATICNLTFAQNSSVFTRAGFSGLQFGYNFEPKLSKRTVSIGIITNFIEKM